VGRPLLLDLFCGAGGVARGYQMAGFHVTGVDVKSQPRYAGDEFVQADALEYLEAHGREYDAIHASPPCQRYSAATKDANKGNHPDLIEPCRDLLVLIGKPWVMENVVGSPFSFAAVLCGSMFGMKVRRHRLFESSFLILTPSCNHAAQPVVLSVTGTGYGGKHKGHNGTKPDGVEYAREVMGINWPMTISELSNAIPPAYCRYVGNQLMQYLQNMG
jgi:DNA (cytosine-5)-methyltransferase 1